LRLNIDRVNIHPLPSGEGRVRVDPGTVLDATNLLLVATSDSAVEILELQPAGKRSMSAAEFLRGHRMQIGDSFGPA
jgi:methionyl-tRNA formyltransferase